MRLYLLLLLAGIIGGLLLMAGIQKGSSGSVCNNISYIYVIYSKTCPHCQYLLEYLRSIREPCIRFVFKEFSKLNKTDIWVLQDYNISIPGVPLVFAVTSNKTVIKVMGFPSKNQDIDGYFYGMDKEMQLCKVYNGTMIYENGTYRFCYVKLKYYGNFYIGNKYAIQYLIRICKDFGCIDIYRNVSIGDMST